MLAVAGLELYDSAIENTIDSTTVDSKIFAVDTAKGISSDLTWAMCIIVAISTGLCTWISIKLAENRPSEIHFLFVFSG